MTKFTYQVTDPVGLHARPAGNLIKFISELSSNISMQKGEKTVDATRLFAVMGLGVKFKDDITFIVEGQNEVKDADALEAFCKENI